MSKKKFHKELKETINEYILLGYKLSKKFPKEELYGMRSQGTRALLSVMLNYVEGFGRTRKTVMINMYEISYGSLKESIYVFYLACQLKYINTKEYMELFEIKEKIGRMLWKTIEGVRNDVKHQ